MPLPKPGRPGQSGVRRSGTPGIDIVLQLSHRSTNVRHRRGRRCTGVRDHGDPVRLQGTAMEMFARSVPGVGDIDAQKSVVRIQDGRPIGKSRLGISGSSAAVKSFP